MLTFTRNTYTGVNRAFSTLTWVWKGSAEGLSGATAGAGFTLVLTYLPSARAALAGSPVHLLREDGIGRSLSALFQFGVDRFVEGCQVFG